MWTMVRENAWMGRTKQRALRYLLLISRKREAQEGHLPEWNVCKLEIVEGGKPYNREAPCDAQSYSSSPQLCWRRVPTGHRSLEHHTGGDIMWSTVWQVGTSASRVPIS